MGKIDYMLENSEYDKVSYFLFIGLKLGVLKTEKDV